MGNGLGVGARRARISERVPNRTSFAKPKQEMTGNDQRDLRRCLGQFSRNEHPKKILQKLQSCERFQASSISPNNLTIVLVSSTGYTGTHSVYELHSMLYRE